MPTGKEIFAMILAQAQDGTLSENTCPVAQDEVAAGDYRQGDLHWVGSDGSHQTILHADGKGWIADRNGDCWDFDTERMTLTRIA